MLPLKKTCVCDLMLFIFIFLIKKTQTQNYWNLRPKINKSSVLQLKSSSSFVPGKFLTVGSATSLHLNLDTEAVFKKINNNVEYILTMSFSSIILLPLEKKMTLRITRAVWVVIAVKILLLDSTPKVIKGNCQLHIVGIIWYYFYSAAEVFCSGNAKHNSIALTKSSSVDTCCLLWFLKHQIKIYGWLFGIIPKVHLICGLLTDGCLKMMIKEIEL